ncbi:outer membrane beta-barrel protein [Octadecabacter sp.]|nr:outer membrane beta-barrel protein [Octadecabacter sp.]
MTKAIFTSAAALTLAIAAAPAFAGNLADPVIAPAPAPIAVAPPVNTGGEWGGFYLGASLGYADISEDDSSIFDDDDVTYGIFGGYNYDFGQFVLGGEVELSGFENSDNGVDVDSVARAKVRAGYDAGRFLPYVTGGYASLDTGGDLNASDEGFLYGLGLDYQVTDSIIVGAEVLQHEFNDFDGTDLDLDATTVSARVSFRF